MKKNMNSINATLFAGPFDDPAEAFYAPADNQFAGAPDPYGADMPLDVPFEPAPEASAEVPLEANIPANASLDTEPGQFSAAGSVFESLRNMSEGNAVSSMNSIENMRSISSAETFAAGIYENIRNALANGQDLVTNPDGSTAFGNQTGASSIGNKDMPQSVRSQGNMESVSNGHTFAGKPENVFLPAEEPAVSAPAYETTRTNLLHILDTDDTHSLPASSLREGGNAESISSGHVFA